MRALCIMCFVLNSTNNVSSFLIGQTNKWMNEWMNKPMESFLLPTNQCTSINLLRSWLLHVQLIVSTTTNRMERKEKDKKKLKMKRKKKERKKERKRKKRTTSQRKDREKEKKKGLKKNGVRDITCVKYMRCEWEWERESVIGENVKWKGRGRKKIVH